MVQLQPHVVVRAHGKVNLALGVGPRRDDGFHSLDTVFQSVSLCDTVTISAEPGEANSKPDISLRVEGLDAAAVPTNHTNLAARAVMAVWDALKPPTSSAPAVTVEIVKNIPVAGGMAGGSADAAAALLGANELFAYLYSIAELSTEQLVKLAAQLGSDVPFTLVGGTQVASGRGEVLSPALSRGQYHWVFAAAPEGLSTPAVFAKLDQLREQSGFCQASSSQGVLAAIARGDATELAKAMVNDLEGASLSLLPRLRATQASASNLGAMRGMVSGSGPTMAFLCQDAQTAEMVAEELQYEDYVRLTKTAVGPAPGAQIMSRSWV